MWWHSLTINDTKADYRLRVCDIDIRRALTRSGVQHFLSSTQLNSTRLTTFRTLVWGLQVRRINCNIITCHYYFNVFSYSRTQLYLEFGTVSIISLLLSIRPLTLEGAFEALYGHRKQNEVNKNDVVIMTTDSRENYRLQVVHLMSCICVVTIRNQSDRVKDNRK